MSHSDVSLTLQTILSGQTTIQGDLSALRESTAKALTRLEVIDTRNRLADSVQVDHESRIRGLERFRYAAVGAALVTSTAAGLVGWLLGHVH